MNQNNVFIAVPCYAGMRAEAVASLLRAYRDLPFPLTIRVLGGVSLVAKARNQLSAEFLASSWTHLLFIDSDIVFEPAQVIGLLSHNEPIVGGFVCVREKKPGYVGGKTIGHDTTRGLLEMSHIGTGFMAIRRDVLEKMREAFGPQIKYSDRGREEWDFFRAGLAREPNGTLVYNSEGWNFCDRARELGYRAYIDWQVIPWHINSGVLSAR